MKKMILACLLTMLMLFACAAAEEGTVVQSSCNIVQDGEYYLVYCFAQVHNNSDQIIFLDEGTLQLSGGEEPLATEKVSRLWPYFLAPGEDGYLFDIIPFGPGESGAAVPQVKGLSYQLSYMTIDPDYAGVQLGADAQLVVDELGGGLSVVCEVSNPTAMAVYNATVAFGLYTDGGQMVYADGMSLKSVGIPAGGSILVRFEVEDVLVEQWRSYNAMPTQVRLNAMFRDNDD